MPKTEFVTDNEFIIRMTAPERQALRKAATNGPRKTYTRVSMDIRAGKRKPLRVPKTKDRNVWVAVKINPTAEEAQCLVEDARRRGISVSKALRADIFQQPVEPPVVFSAESQFTVRANPETRALLAAIRKQDRFRHLLEVREGVAFAEIARTLMADAL